MEGDIDIFVIGSCMTDLICYSPQLPKPGETVCGRKFSVGFGGKGANQCIAASRLGARCALLAKLGNDGFGKSYMTHLKESGIDTKFVKVVDGESSGVAQICVADTGENSIVIIPGANKSLVWSDIDNAEIYIRQAKVVLFQFETPLEVTLYALEECKKYSTCTTIVNGAPAVPHLDEQILRLADIFCVNEIEAETVTGIPINSIPCAFLAAQKLTGLGCKLAIITLGPRGAVFNSAEDNIPTHVPVTNVERPVDTTGAGDSFLGAVAFFLAKYQYPLYDIIKYACEVARLSVLKPGTQSSFPSREELRNVL